MCCRKLLLYMLVICVRCFISVSSSPLTSTVGILNKSVAASSNNNVNLKGASMDLKAETAVAPLTRRNLIDEESSSPVRMEEFILKKTLSDHEGILSVSEEQSFFAKFSEEASSSSVDSVDSYPTPEQKSQVAFASSSDTYYNSPLLISLIPETYESLPVSSNVEESLDPSHVAVTSPSNQVHPLKPTAIEPSRRINTKSRNPYLEPKTTSAHGESANTFTTHEDNPIYELKVGEIIKRQVHLPDDVVFSYGVCQECDKVLVRDTIVRSSQEGHVSTIVSYDGIGCDRNEEISCVKITDRSDEGDGATVYVKSGAVGHPYIRLNITSHFNKGYRLFLEIRGIDLTNPNCP